MRYEIYCDESHPDVFWSQSAAKAHYLCIGGLWLSVDLRAEVKERLRAIRNQHGLHGELKWHKVYARWEGFYRDLIDLFIQYDAEAMRFRCIVVDGRRIDLNRFHEADAELGFYKFYYQMLVHWLEAGHEYAIFCDEKTNRQHDRLFTLQRVLRNSCSATIHAVQALPSHEVQLIQLTDFLLGIVSSRFNNGITTGGTKDHVSAYLEERLGYRSRLAPTTKGVRKFNIFKIDLQGAMPCL